jgi:tetratricopeptide (TPR) repeat protein
MLKLGSMRTRVLAALAASLIATAAQAAAIAAAPESPGTALSRHIRVLASNPRDFTSLVGAGRASLELGDVQAAAGFFGRAEEVNPNAPAAKAGLGAAMAHMGDPDGAIFYFDQASRLGASVLTIALDRGLARDLNGDLAAAQSDYRLAIASLNSDEGRRRLALSLAIARRRSEPAPSSWRLSAIKPRRYRPLRRSCPGVRLALPLSSATFRNLASRKRPLPSIWACSRRMHPSAWDKLRPRNRLRLPDRQCRP